MGDAGGIFGGEVTDEDEGLMGTTDKGFDDVLGHFSTDNQCDRLRCLLIANSLNDLDITPKYNALLYKSLLRVAELILLSMQDLYF